jgi:drug/metabolite transporter (DMT)-like permease
MIVAGMSNTYTSLRIIIGPSIAGILFDIHINLPYLLGAVLILISLLLTLFKHYLGKKIIKKHELNRKHLNEFCG